MIAAVVTASVACWTKVALLAAAGCVDVEVSMNRLDLLIGQALSKGVAYAIWDQGCCEVTAEGRNSP